jgi:hypothetical protein
MNTEHKTRKNRALIAGFALLAALFTLAGCMNPLSLGDDAAGPSGKALPPGKGAFLMVTAGRTILPDAPDTDAFGMYTLAFTPTNGGEAETVDRTNGTLSTDPMALVPGTYSLAVNAYKDSGKQQLMAQGTLNNITITDGNTTTGTVTLQMLRSGGEGTFKYAITFPAGATATMDIRRAEASGTPDQPGIALTSGA